MRLKAILCVLFGHSWVLEGSWLKGTLRKRCITCGKTEAIR